MTTPLPKDDSPKTVPQVYQVDRILQRGKAGGQTYYLVQWKGYSDSDATWQPLSNLSGCKDAILEFEKVITMINGQKDDHQTSKDSKSVKSKTKHKSSAKQEIQRLKKTQTQKNSPKLHTQRNPHPKKQKGQTLQESLNAKTCNEDTNIKTSYWAKQKNLTSNSVKSQYAKTQAQRNYQNNEQDNLQATTAQTIPIKHQPETEKLKDSRNSSDKYASKIKVNDKKKHSILPVAQDEQIQKYLVQQDRKQVEKTLTCLKRSHEQCDIDQGRDNIQKNKKVNKGPSYQSKEILFNKQTEITPVKALNQQKKVSAFDKIMKIQPVNEEQSKSSYSKSVSKGSRSFRICEQFFTDLKIQAIERLTNSKPKVRLDDTYDEIKRQSSGTESILFKFLDLSDSKSNLYRSKIIHKILSKSQVQMLDVNGDFLDSKIQTVIKLRSSSEKIIQFEWICVLKCFQSNCQHSICSDDFRTYFVRTDDLKQDVWRRMFRKFTTINPV